MRGDHLPRVLTTRPGALYGRDPGHLPGCPAVRIIAFAGVRLLLEARPDDLRGRRGFWVRSRKDRVYPGRGDHACFLQLRVLRVAGRAAVRASTLNACADLYSL